ncbi:hypothetical protein I5080_19810 [Salmonella enterica]|nr:hypothetical protein I5080_19810 [Salmonella enterica]
MISSRTDELNYTTDITLTPTADAQAFLSDQTNLIPKKPEPGRHLLGKKPKRRIKNYHF